MRWRISRRGHDPRHIDLLAALALIIVIIAAWRFFESGSGTETLCLHRPQPKRSLVSRAK